MKDLRRKFNRFCFKHRDKGIPNLMLYVSLGAGLVYLMSGLTRNYLIYDLLVFDRARILQGEIWRLISYPLTYSASNALLTVISLFCYFSLGQAMENQWGTFRFNLFYFTGIVLMDVYCMLFGLNADVFYLNLSLLLSYATMYPQTRFLILYVIPVKAWILALFYLVVTFYRVISLSVPYFLFPLNLFPLVALANYFLFFGKEVLNVIPMSWRANFRRLFRKGKQKVTQKQGPKVVPFPTAGSYEATVATPKGPYTHRCTICGRTDLDSPELEFRYCSRCKGYHCYCVDHISNHTHIE